MKNLKLKKFIFVLTLFTVLNLIFSYPLLAADGNESLTNVFRGRAGIPMGEEVTVGVAVGYIIRTVLTLLAILFVALMVYGGYLWMTAGGNEESVKKAKTLITNSIIGLAIAFTAYAIGYFIIKALVEAGQPTGLELL